MLWEGNSDIIDRTERKQRQKQEVELLHFHEGLVICLSPRALAVYKNASSVFDPLGNGLVSVEDLPPGQFLDPQISPWVHHHAAGYVNLYDGRGLLILPTCCRLYSTREDALNNHHIIVELSFNI